MSTSKTNKAAPQKAAAKSTAKTTDAAAPAKKALAKPLQA
jgi:hypothetical protein